MFKPTPMPRRCIVPLAAIFLVAALPASLKAQGTAEQQEACTPDAVKLCAATIPDIPKTTACMKAHVAELSPRCRAAFADATASPAPKARVAAREDRPRLTREERSHVSREEPSRAALREERRARIAGRTAEVPVRPSRIAPEPPASRDARRGPEQTGPETDEAVAVAPPPRSSVPGLTSYRAQIAEDCREGLIDPFTCRSTLQALSAIE